MCTAQEKESFGKQNFSDLKTEVDSSAVVSSLF